MPGRRRRLMAGGVLLVAPVPDGSCDAAMLQSVQGETILLLEHAQAVIRLRRT